MPEQSFEVVRFNEAKLLKYSGASHPQDRSLKADLFLSSDIFDDYENAYAQVVPRMRHTWPTPQEFADETLADILCRGWRNIPTEVRGLLATTRTAVFSAHGNTYSNSQGEDSDWYAHIEGDHVIEIPTLIKYLSDYETIILGVCNPGRIQPASFKGTLIYPSYMFGLSDETEMLTKTAQI
jgi:hypothetical protein